MKLLKIDEQGFFIEDVVVNEIPQITVEDEEGNITLTNDPQYIEKPCPDGFYLPRWVGDWVEGASQETLDLIEAQRIDQLLTPSQAEVDKATREIETITLLTDLGVI